MKYRRGYRNQLAETFTFQLPYELWPPAPIVDEFFSIDCEGWAIIRKGYAWDGASGPTADIPRKQIAVPALVHDMLCQLGRAGLMEGVPDARKHADELLYSMLRQRGMNYLRAKIWYFGVRFGSHMDGGPKEILEAE
jgi:hypothetical protein